MNINFFGSGKSMVLAIFATHDPTPVPYPSPLPPALPSSIPPAPLPSSLLHKKLIFWVLFATDFSSEYFPNADATQEGHSLLAALSHIVIREKVRLSQILLGWEQPNVYSIEDKFGVARHPLLYAQEQSDCLSRQCLPSGVRGRTRWTTNFLWAIRRRLMVFLAGGFLRLGIFRFRQQSRRGRFTKEELRYRIQRPCAVHEDTIFPPR